MKTHRIDLARLLAGTAPRAFASSIRNEVSPAELITQMKASLDTTLQGNNTKFAAIEKTVADLNAALDAKTKDVVSEIKVNAISAALDKQIAELKASSAEVGKLDKSIDAVQKEIDGMNAKISALALNGTGGGGRKADPRASNPDFNAYCKTFASWFRKGGETATNELASLEVKAAMTTQSSPDGGFTVIPEMDTAIDEVLKEVSMMRSLATVRQIGTGMYKKLVNQHGTTSGWVGETDTRSDTTGPNLSELQFPVMEIYARPVASQTLLDDSFVNIEQWLADEVNLEFAYQEGSAYVSGTGANKPKGIVGGYTPAANASYAWGAPGFIASGASAAFVADPNGDKCLIDTYFGLKSIYRTNAVWLMNRGTISAIRKLKDSNGMSLLINMSNTRDGMIEELMGRPVVEMPDMPDMAANSYSIALGDWRRAYLIVDRIGTRVLRDPFTSPPYVKFYTTKRVGGGVQNFEAYKLLKFSA